MTLFIINIIKGILLTILIAHNLLTSALRAGWYARYCSVAVHRNGDLGEARQYHTHHMFSAQHTYVTDFYLKMLHDSIENAF